MAIGFSRKINGIVYNYDEQFNNKSDATKYRKEMGAKGYRAVVLENPPDYKGDRKTYVVFTGGKKYILGR